MADTTTSGVGGLSYVGSPGSTESSSNMAIDAETFLKLLVAQLQYQDPLEPQSNTDFAAQLAQMSSLTQLQEMNSSMDITRASGYVGKNITASVLDSDTGVTTYYTGEVSSVVLKNGNVYCVVGDTAIMIDNIISVSEASSASTTDSTDTTDSATSGTSTDTTDQASGTTDSTSETSTDSSDVSGDGADEGASA